MLAPRLLCVALLFALGLAPATQPATEPAISASGTWKWQVAGRNGVDTDFTLKLKQDGDKLTGVLNGFNGQVLEVKDGAVKDGRVTFTVMRKRNDQEIATTYTGRIEGDTIRGSVETDTSSREWQAVRIKDPA